MIFTDLDGTLLELETYSFDAAKEALTLVKERRIPLVFCSSKTCIEQEFYQKEMGLREPFIVENGSAILVPEGYFPFEFSYNRSTPEYKIIELGVGIEVIRSELKRVCDELNLDFRGYDELSHDELCRITGLNSNSARRALSRDYSETITGNVSQEDAARLNEALRGSNLSSTRGSRFYTVAAASIDKGRAVALLTDLFRRCFGTVTTIGIGDGSNDEPMLAAVDHPFLLQRPDRSWADVNAPRLKRIDAVGPAGWNRLISNFIHTGFLP